MNLKDKVIFVTGAGQGIGRATSLLLSSKYGATIAALDNNGETVQKVVNEIKANNGEAIALVADITDRAAIKGAVDRIIATYGRIEVLYNNAAMGGYCKMLEASDEFYDRLMDVNVKGSFIVATEVAKVMIPLRKGRIIQVSSIAGIQTTANNGVYGMSKAAVKVMAQALALELGEYNISAVTIHPGNVKIEKLHAHYVNTAKKLGITTEEYYKKKEAEVPLGRLAEMEDIAEVVAFLY